MKWRGGSAVRGVAAAACVVLVGWGAWAGWQLYRARRAGQAVREAVSRALPEGGAPRRGARQELEAAARHIESGEFAAAAEALAEAGQATGPQRAAAQRFFARAKELRQRMVTVTAAAKAQEADGEDVAIVRDALARAVLAAASDDEPGVEAQLRLAEAVVAAPGGAGGLAAGAGPEQTLAALAAGIAPAYELGRDAMTEGHAAVEKLLRRASRRHREGRTAEAVRLAALAASLAGVGPAAEGAKDIPKWFLALADAPASVPATAAASSRAGQAEEAVNLAEAMAAAGPSDGPIRGLLRAARRELEAGNAAEATWWATVALNALGMTDAAIERALAGPEGEGRE